MSHYVHYVLGLPSKPSKLFSVWVSDVRKVSHVIPNVGDNLEYDGVIYLVKEITHKYSKMRSGSDTTELVSITVRVL